MVFLLNRLKSIAKLIYGTKSPLPTSYMYLVQIASARIEQEVK